MRTESPTGSPRKEEQPRSLASNIRGRIRTAMFVAIGAIALFAGAQEIAEQRRDNAEQRISSFIKSSAEIAMAQFGESMKDVDYWPEHILRSSSSIDLETTMTGGWKCMASQSEKQAVQTSFEVITFNNRKILINTDENGFQMVVDYEEPKEPSEEYGECMGSSKMWSTFKYLLYKGEWGQNGKAKNTTVQMLLSRAPIDSSFANSSNNVQIAEPLAQVSASDQEAIGQFLQKYITEKATWQDQAEKTTEEVRTFTKALEKVGRKELLDEEENKWINNSEITRGFITLAKMAGIPLDVFAERVANSQLNTEFRGYSNSDGGTAYQRQNGKYVIETGADTNILFHEWIHLLNMVEVWNDGSSHSTIYEEGSTMILECAGLGTKCEKYRMESLLTAALGPELYIERIRDPKKYHETVKMGKNGLRNKNMSTLISEFAERWNIGLDEDQKKLAEIFEIKKEPFSSWEDYYSKLRERVQKLKKLVVENGAEWETFLESIEPEKGDFMEYWKSKTK